MLIWSSSPGEFHPQALTDRYVTVSRHTAPASLPLESSRSQAYAKETRFLPVSWLPIACCELTHPLRSSPITGPSSLLQDNPPLCPASVRSRLWGRHLRFSLYIGTTGCWVDQSLPTFTPADPTVRLSRNGLLPKVTQDQLRQSFRCE